MSAMGDYYDYWVNGKDLRISHLALGGRPRRALAQSERAVPRANDWCALELDRYDGTEPALRVDARALEPVRHVLVHGSVATGETCGFSDVDVAVILDDSRSFSCDQHEAAVAELRLLLAGAYGFDRLMHHGLMFFMTSGLGAYDQTFLPIETLKLARVVHGPRSFAFHSSTVPPELFRERLRNASESLRKRFSSAAFLENDFALKTVLSGVLLMPSRVLATRGIHVYKRDSFRRAREFFDESSWELVERAEALRSLWIRPRPSLAGCAVPRRAHPHLRSIVESRFGPRLNTRRLSRKMIEGLERSARAFFERVEVLA
ncbi:MAG TPA: nucleotidyltransferase domain-containing protein [Candidatus Baltobacteraceae bacterium]|jgi:hypothetical protein